MGEPVRFQKEKKHGTAAVITRILQDQAEATGDKLFMVFLDLERAFDKDDQEKLIDAMYSLGATEQIVNTFKFF